MFHPRGAGTLFNWFTTPTFAAALLFWLLAAYVLTRGRRDAVSVAAFVALASTAAYLLGEAMEANAPSPDDWRPWARGLRWGAPVATMAWYWVTALFLREQGTPVGRRYLHQFGYPLGWMFMAVGFTFALAMYVDDWLHAWSVAPYEVTDPGSYFRYYPPPGPLYPAFTIFVVGAALCAAINLSLARRAPPRILRHRRHAWLLLSATLFIPEVVSVTTYHWLGVALPTWFNHLCLAAAMVLMATNVTAYHHLRHGQTIRADLSYFIVTWAVACVGFAPIFLLVGGGYSFQVLGLLSVTLALLIFAHAVADPVRRDLDRLFFGRDVQRLRSSLTTVVQDAALARDHNLGALLSQAQSELQEVSADHQARLTQEALRRLNAPAGLADCALAEQLPRTLTEMLRRDPAAAGAGEGKLSEPTPLERARALRAALIQALERLKPPDDGDPGAPTALQYHILHEAYVLGRPNRQIMVRRGISESTFHRNRRDAIAVLSRELARQEERLASE